MPPPRIVLHFFNIGGRGRAIRIAFALGKIPYEDKRYTFDEFEKLQLAGSLTFGALPVMDVNGERLAQSRALLRYAGKLAGLYPQDELAAARCDMAIDAMEEVADALGNSLFLGPEAKLVERGRIATVEVPRLFGPLEARLAASPTHCIAGIPDTGAARWGDGGLSIGDIAIFSAAAWLTGGYLDGIDAATVLGAYPATRELVARIGALPEVATLEAGYL